MKEKRGEEENPLVEEEKEQEHKRIEGDIKKLGEQKWYLKSKIIYVLLLYYAANWLFVCFLIS